jgi:hypothetical protein
MPPSPIQLSRIIKPQSHQKDFHEEKKFYLKQRRNRRGRPKRDEYIYVCDEKCGFCGGGWGEIVDAENGECKEEKMGEQVETVDKVKPIDVELMDDDEVLLIRCKDCRGAFHPKCMLLNGKVADNDESGVACGSDETSQSKDEASVQSNRNAGTFEKAEDVSMEVEYNTMQMPIRTDHEGNTDDVQELHSIDENANYGRLNNDEKSSEVESTTEAEQEGTQTLLVASNNNDGNNLATSQSTNQDCNSGDAVTTEIQDVTSAVANDKRAMEGVDVAVSESLSEDETKPVSSTPVEAVDNEDAQESDGYVLTRHPKRCCRCDAIHKSRLDQDPGDKRSCNSSEDMEPPSKKRRVFRLEAVISGKPTMCSVKPTPVLEAELNGKSIAIYILFDGKRKNRDALVGDCTINLKQAAAKIAPKPKSRATSSKHSHPIARKCEKIVSKATDRINDADIQESSIVAIRNLVDGKDSAAVVMNTGACEMLVNAMANHPYTPSIQVESIRAMSEIVWYNASFAEELVQQGCLELTVSAMDSHGTNQQVQNMGCELFRALSYDSKAARAMFEAEAVAAVVKSIQRNQKDLETLTEGR